MKKYELIKSDLEGLFRIRALKDFNDVIKCNIGCQKRMTLKKLLKRIKSDGGMQPHREQYVKIMENAHLILK